ncbi:MAG: T9SS type A sorting domain-containing protein [Ignavibacteria bacterium]|nr:T9SS type A sorting domain-containing protein [Ignavibacteria bacterium]
MKKWAALVFICYSINSFPQLPVSPRFSELKGIEDQQGNTHLFYRIYSVEPVFLGAITDNSVYHFDLSNNSDTLYFKDKIIKSVSQSAIIVGDYDHWNNDPNLFIYGGAFIFEYVPHPEIYRFDGQGNFISGGCGGVVGKIKISFNDDSLIYAGIRDDFYPYPKCSIISTDGGWNWEGFSDDYVFQSILPDQDSILFAISKTSKTLYKTTNSGLTYYEVDTSAASPVTYFNYDPDGQHIYRISSSPFFSQYILRVSDDRGEPLTWQTSYVSSSDIYISNDQFTTGVIYLANNRNLYLSTNFGDNFNLVKTFNKNIVGIYKKHDSNLLYAATKHKIYEISPDSVQIIKSLPIPNDVLNIYPLPIDFELSQNYPNPFNPNTTIKYQVPELSFVTIKVYDILGTEVATLVNEQKPARSYEVEFDGSGFPSGIYFYQLQAGDFIETKKMVLLK